MKLVADAGADLDSTDYDGVTPLRLAAQLGRYLTACHCVLSCGWRSVEIVQVLLDAGAAINAQDVLHVSNKFQGESALMLAVRGGHAAVVMLLVQRGADINARDMKGTRALLAASYQQRCYAERSTAAGMSAFHSAAASGQEQLVECLLTAGADINAVDHCGKTPIYLAVEHGYSKVIKILAQHGANVGLRDLDGRSALHWAADNQQGEAMIQVLAACGADVDIADNVNNSSPLHLAAARGFVNSCLCLLQCGANIRAKDVHKRTAIHIAAHCCREAVLRALIAAPGASCKDLDSLGRTALHLACEAGNLPIARMCIQAATPVNVVDAHGLTALHLASKSGVPQLVHYMCAQGAAPDVQSDSLHQSPLHKAAISGNGSDAILALLRAGAHHGARDSSGATALIAAAQVGDAAAVAMLTRAVEGDGLNTRDHTGRSALFWAVANNHIQAAEVLIEYGAEIEATVESSGCTVLHIAVEHGHLDMISWLLKQSAAKWLLAATDKEYGVSALGVACACASNGDPLLPQSVGSSMCPESNNSR